MVKEGKTNRELAEMDFAVYARIYKAIDRVRSYIRPKREEGYKPYVVLLQGMAGCGKTRWAYDKYPNLWEPAINTIKGGGTWFDGYDGQDVALIDEFRGKMPLDAFLKVIDLNYIRNTPIKGGFCWFNPKVIIITSNHHPSKWYDFQPSEKWPEGRIDDAEALRRRINFVYAWDKANKKFVEYDNTNPEDGICSDDLKRYWPITEIQLKKVDDTISKKRKAVPVDQCITKKARANDFVSPTEYNRIHGIIIQPDEESTQDPNDVVIAEPVEDMELEQAYKDMLADVLGPQHMNIIAEPVEDMEPTVGGIPHSIFYENLL